MKPSITICARCNRLIRQKNTVSYDRDEGSTNLAGPAFLALCLQCAAAYYEQLSMLESV